MKRLIFLIFLIPTLLFGQSLVKNGNNLVVSPFRYIANSEFVGTGTGTYSVVNAGTVNEYLNCSVAGTAFVTSKQAYGEWYFDVYIGTNNSVLRTSIISNNILPYNDYNGYGFYTTGGLTGGGFRQLMGISKSNSGSGSVLMQTPEWQVALTTWYQYKVTRSITGVTTVYYKGGAFGNLWKLVSVTTGSNPFTDNTYTTSNYFVLDLDAGDRIRNVRFRKLTGSYETLVKVK